MGAGVYQEMKRILLFIMQTKFYSWLLLHIIPYIRFTTYYTSLRGNKYHQGYDLLRPGHIILTVDRKKLTSLLIPGDFSHAAFCVGKYPEEYEVAEMTHTNYTKSHFFDICKEADRVVILECPDFSAGYIQQMIDNCMSFETATYDLSFDLGVKALYCSELVYQADFRRILKVDLSDLAGLGRAYISPDGLYAAKNVRVVWDSDNP
jgi:hypothetical protein